MSAATTRQRIRGAQHQAWQRNVEEGVAEAYGAGSQHRPISPEPLAPVHTSYAYAVAEHEREEARARKKRAAEARAAAKKRVSVVSSEPIRKETSEPDRKEVDRQSKSTLLGIDGGELRVQQLVASDGKPLGAEQLVAPDGRPLSSERSADSLWFDDAELLFDLFDEEIPELEELRRRDSYGWYLELAHVIREFGRQYLEQARREGLPTELLERQERVLRDLMGCRTAAMGEHEWNCGDCGKDYRYFNSCGNRHCPKCREGYRREWAEKLERDLLPVEYHHVILTLPRVLTELVMAHAEVLYAKVMRAGGSAILAVGEKLLNAQLAAQIMLHTWGQIQNNHVHLHSLVPGGGMPYDDPQGKAWIGFPKKGEFLSLEILANEFRDLLLQELEKAHASGELELTGRWRSLESHDAFQSWLDPLREISWVVKHRVWTPRGLEKGAPYDSVVGYLARYVNRVVMANNRLAGIDDDQVEFRYKDYRDGDQWKTRRVPGVQFLERFLRHMLPPNFHNKRRVGFWGYRVRTKNLALIRKEMGVPPVQEDQEDEPDEAPGEEPQKPRARHCALCKAELTHVGGTLRPTVPIVLDMVWEDMQRAVDVHPDTYRVRTHTQIWEAEQRRLSELRWQALREEMRKPCESRSPEAKKTRGPPPDRQRRLEVAPSTRDPDALLNPETSHVA